MVPKGFHGTARDKVVQVGITWYKKDSMVQIGIGWYK